MRRKLLIISHVSPFPGQSGQQLRVRYTVAAAVREFDVDFLTYASATQINEVREQLATLGCRPIILKSCLPREGLKHLAHYVASRAYVLRTGMKTSNYAIGKVEFAPNRIRSAIVPTHYNAVLYEYFHAVNSVPVFQRACVPTILDMHNVLWKSKEQRLSERNMWPAWIKQTCLNRYRQREESAWDRFDALIAINRSESRIIQVRQPQGQKLFYTPMGTDLTCWPSCWEPATPPRLAYYGGLGSSHNEAAALRCHERIMPTIWQRFPNAELWLVGSSPSNRLQRLTSDPRVKVTGFVEKVQDVLRTMSLVFCPWVGNYGFRSRIIEVMALGVPVVATSDAVDGMELESGRGIILANTNEALAEAALKLLSEPSWLGIQSRIARAEMERLYSLENTYGRLMTEISEWLETRKQVVAGGRQMEMGNQS